jgi:hypothetical protein
MIPLTQAAEIKNTSRQAVWQAIQDGRLDGTQPSRDWFVLLNDRWTAWEPRRQRIIPRTPDIPQTGK